MKLLLKFCLIIIFMNPKSLTAQADQTYSHHYALLKSYSSSWLNFYPAESVKSTTFSPIVSITQQNQISYSGLRKFPEICLSNRTLFLGFLTAIMVFDAYLTKDQIIYNLRALTGRETKYPPKNSNKLSLNILPHFISLSYIF